MTLRCITVNLALVSMAALSAPAQSAGLAEAEACRQALDSLQKQEESRRGQLAGARAAADQAVEVARRKAATDCLGGPADAPPAAPRLQAPLSVVPTAPLAAAGSAPPSALGQLLPLPNPAANTLPVIRPPTTVNHCDSAGCWTSDGTYLMRVGPNLVGPPGLCSVQANLLFCR